MYFKYKKTVFSYKRKKIRDCDKKIYVFFFFLNGALKKYILKMKIFLKTFSFFCFNFSQKSEVCQNNQKN